MADQNKFQVTALPATLTMPWGEVKPRDMAGDMADDGAVLSDSTRDQANAEFKGQDVIEVNGINTNVAGQERQISQLESVLHQHVTGIHVGTLGSQQADLTGSLPQEKADTRIEDLAPEKVLKDKVASDLQAGKPVHIIAHSRGALVTQRALEGVVSDMQAQGKSDREIKAAMSHVTVETFAGAAKSFPSGVKNVDYVDPADPVPNLFGKGTPSLESFQILANGWAKKDANPTSFSTTAAGTIVGVGLLGALGNVLGETRAIGSSHDDTIVFIPPTVDGKHAASESQVSDAVNTSPSATLGANHDFFWYLQHRESYSDALAGEQQYGDTIEH